MSQSLTFRHELKYQISQQQYYVLRQRLSRLLERDEHAIHNGEYHIRSLYFDDIHNSALHDKLGGISNRQKYRIRIYNFSDKVIHFEKKIKRQEFIAKQKEPLSRQLYEDILNGDYERLQQENRPLLQEIYHLSTHKLLRPKVIVDYIREPFVCSNGNVRITFDKSLRSGQNSLDLFNRHLPTVPVLDHNNIIMEVKYDEYLPERIRSALQLDGLIWQAASKYVLCRKWLKQNMWEDQ